MIFKYYTMKKNYFITLLLIFFASITYGQNLLTNGDLESWDSDTKPTGWTKAENVTKDATEKHGGAFSALINEPSKTKDLAQTVSGIEPGASYTISFWYKASGDGTDARIWSVWKNGTTTVYQQGSSTNASGDPLRGPDNKYLDNNGGVWTQYSVTVTAPTGVDALNFEVRAYKNSKVYFDDLSVVKNSQTVPTLTITAPTDGSSIASSSVNVSLSVQNFTVGNTQTDDGYIKYSVDGAAAVNKYDTNDIALTGLTDGSHKVEVELVKTDGSPLDTPVKKEVNFTVSSYVQVANLAGLRAGTQGEFYEVTGEVILTYDAGGSRNQKYIQDSSGAILIDDNNGVITTSYNQYDGIKGLKGKLSSYNGTLQFVPSEDPGAANSNGNTITIQEVSLANLKANIADYQSEWVKITAATFNDADGNAVFEAKKNYDISNGSETIVFRTNFTNADYIGNVIPAGEHSITGIAGQFNSTVQIYATEASGIALGTTKNEIEGFGVYPNPVTSDIFTLKTASTTTKNVSIFNILGKQVLVDKISGNNAQINVAALNTGIYILKVEENGKIATKKLVIK